MNRVPIRGLLVILLLAALAVFPAGLVFGQAKYSAGEKVEARFAGKWVPAEVIRTISKGRIEVELVTEQGVRITPILREEMIRRTGPAPKVPKVTETKFKKGDRVQVEWGAKWIPGEVVGYLRQDLITVKIVPEKGMEITPTLPLRHVRPASGAAAAAEQAPARTAHGRGMRTWTDASGKYKTEAEFVEFKDGKVTLKKKNGKTVTLPLDRLSEHDRQHAIMLAAEAHSGWDSDWDDDWDDEFDKLTEEIHREMPGAFGGAAGPVRVTRANASAAARITPTDPGAWSVAPDLATSSRRLTDRPIALPSPQGGPESPLSGTVQGLLMQPAEGAAYVVYHNQWGPQGSAALVKCDLVQGKALGAVTIPIGDLPVDVDPSGRRILAMSSYLKQADNERLDVWDLAGDEARHVVSFHPYATAVITERNLEYAALLDADYALTLNSAHRPQLVLWNLASARAIYALQVAPFSLPALSPGRRQLAVATDRGIFLLDARSGNTLGRLDGHLDLYLRFCFSEDGRHLAALSYSTLQVWDLTTGHRTAEAYFAKPLVAEQVDWVDDGYLLVNGSLLVDVQRRIILWEYHYPRGETQSGHLGGAQWYLLRALQGAKGLVPFTLPHAGARQAAERLDPEKLLALKPGMEVSVRVNVDLPQQEQRQIYDSLASRLTGYGMKLVQGSRLVFEASTGEGKSVGLSYQNRRGGGRSTQIAYQVSKLTCQEAGQLLWEVQQIKGAPSIVLVEKGQSLDAAVAAEMKPDLAFFLTTPIPKYLARQADRGAYGQSAITPQGIQPAMRR